jgi:hypothetical protein
MIKMALRTIKPFDTDAVPAPATADPVVLPVPDTIVGSYRKLAHRAITALVYTVPVALIGWGLAGWAVYTMYTTPPETWTTLIDPVDKTVTTVIRGAANDPGTRDLVELATAADTAWRMRRIGSDPTITAEVQAPLEYVMSIRAQNQLSAYWDLNPPEEFYEKGYVRRASFEEPQRDPVVQTLIHVNGRERVLDRYNREVSSSPVTIKFWLASNPVCQEKDVSRALNLKRFNPNCVVIDELDQGSLK